MSQTTTPLPSLMDPAVQSCPYDLYKRLRDEQPVYRMPETGFYVVTRYDDVRHVLQDTDNFRNGGPRPSKEMQGPAMAIHEQMLAERGWTAVETLQRSDPPAHTRYRKLVNRVFTPRRVNNDLKPRVEAVTDELIDGFIDRGTCELVNDFAIPLPGTVMTEQLGLDRSQVATFRQWVDALLAPKMYPLTEDEMVAVTETALVAQHHFAAVFEERRRNPTGDLMSALANSHLAGGEEPLTMNELQDLVHQLIAGGFETTATAIAHGMWLLLRNPDQMELLRSDLDRYLPGFVEETLRIESPAQGLTRRTARDVELSGTVIPAGSVVIVRYGAANHDETQFPDPERFDITRDNLNAHVAFGKGAHFCVGAALARAEITSAFRALLTRLANIRLARPLPEPPHRPNLLLMAFKELHLEFSRADPA